VVRPPGVVNEFAIGATAQQLGVAILKFTVQLTECCDFGGAHKGKILGPEEEDLPLVFEVLVADGLKRFSFFEANDGLQGISRELMSNT
jgi:hypothetical protein